MNNKKLFKGALVLFASILMAVSCSNNNTSPEGDGNSGGNINNKQEVDIKIKTSEAASVKLGSSVTTDKVLKLKLADGTLPTAKDISLVFEGTDLENVDLSVETVKGLSKTIFDANTGITKDDGTGVTEAQRKDISSLAANKGYVDLTTTSFASTGALKIAENTTLTQALIALESISADKDAGLIEVTLKFTPKEAIKNTKKEKLIKVYFALQAANTVS